MDGAHDIGGMQDFGGGPGGRPTREAMPAADYLAASYYQRWLWSAERRLERKGHLQPGEVERMMEQLAASEPEVRQDDPELAARAVAAVQDPAPPLAPATGARFAVGDQVRVRRMRPGRHTRCPRYVRGATGRIERVHGLDAPPELAAYGEPATPEPVYAVAFDSRDLWGEDVRPPWALLVAKGLVTTDAVDAVISYYEHDVGPQNGAKVVARAWLDPAYRQRLLSDGTAAIAELGYGGAEGDNLVVVANTPSVHNAVVCTLCSCYPWPVLGLPPAWYKSLPYRARMVAEPRAVLREFGLELPAEVEIRVWDSSAEVRYLVLPMRPPGTEGWSQQRLAGIVTRDCMIGTAAPSTDAAP